MPQNQTDKATGRRLTDVEITPEMIEAGMEALWNEEADFYDTTTRADKERVLAAVFAAMSAASR